MCYQYQAQYGVGPWIKEDPLIWMSPRRLEKDPSVSLKVANKMIKLVSRGYITEGVILVLKSLFSVPKVTEDVCLVFDATISGLTKYLWGPNFMLLSMVSLLMMVGPETHIVNLYVGEMFYNFRLSSVPEKYYGLYLGSYMGHMKYRQGTPLWMKWVRLMMVLMLSTYDINQVLLLASDVLRGDRSEPDNPFR